MVLFRIFSLDSNILTIIYANDLNEHEKEFNLLNILTSRNPNFQIFGVNFFFGRSCNNIQPIKTKETQTFTEPRPHDHTLRTVLHNKNLMMIQSFHFISNLCTWCSHTMTHYLRRSPCDNHFSLW